MNTMAVAQEAGEGAFNGNMGRNVYKSFDFKR
jgi:hypothetical protein